MNEQKEFLDWWNGYDISEDNPYREDSPLYWAWEGFLVGLRVEREVCAKLAEKELHNITVLTSMPLQSSAAWTILQKIRARGEVK